MKIVLILGAALAIFFLWHLAKRNKTNSDPVSNTDKLAGSEDYSQKLEQCADRLSALNDELAACRKEYEQLPEGEEKEAIGNELKKLEKQRELIGIKCNNLLKKLD